MFYNETIKKIVTAVLTYNVFLVIGTNIYGPSWFLMVLGAIGNGLILAWSVQALNQQNQKQQQLYTIRQQSDDRLIALLRKQNESIITYLPYPLLMIDAYGKIELTNDSFKNLLDHKQDSLTIRSESIPYPIRKMINEVYLNEHAITTNIHVNDIDYLCSSTPIKQKGRYQGCLVVLQDITKLLVQEKNQKRFVADASHELKTPITAIKGMIEILTRKQEVDEETRKEFLEQVKIQTDRLQTIVADLLYLSKLSNQRIYLQKQPVDIVGIIKEVEKTFALALKENNLKLKINVKESSIVYGDAHALMTVLSNLIDNAIHYSKDNVIEITIDESNQQHIITIKDYGIGIAKEDLPYVFDRFYRVFNDRNRTTGGSGLGLAITKEIIDAHLGDITIESEINQGSSFIFTLPKLTKS